MIGEPKSPGTPQDQHSATPVPLCDQVEAALQLYFQQLDGHYPSSLYKLVLQEVEPPLLRTVLQYTAGNQSRAAEILGLDRSTLRKKLKLYSLG